MSATHRDVKDHRRRIRLFHLSTTSGSSDLGSSHLDSNSSHPTPLMQAPPTLTSLTPPTPSPLILSPPTRTFSDSPPLLPAATVEV